MTQLGDSLAALNALLNAASAALVCLGWWAVRHGDRARHRKLMLSALGLSALFLVSYLVRVALTGTHRYPGHGAAKALYLFVLLTHMPLAALTPPLVLRAAWLALKGRYAEHRRVVRWALPIWLYVSATGVLVYALLYSAL